ncbi:hypothetical protein [Pseudonocardia spinosispora]|uniref:hypothetical protein n=1 Tax=Pseudonocardia spinosispora TaxID=103441 RepID=UPI00049186AF|nr:hypothetical protein [Pseudonocardia spinosispora]
MPEEDSVERQVRKLVVDHAETRWLTLRVDDDVKELRQETRAIRAIQERQSAILEEHTVILREHSDQLQEHTNQLQEHTARFDSVDAQLRSLTQMVGKVLERLPEEPAE